MKASFDFCIQEIKIGNISILNPKEILSQIEKSDKFIPENNSKDTICIYSRHNKQLNAYCLMAALETPDNSSNKGILITHFWAEDSSLAKQILSECVKFAWETGFHAAFTTETNKAFNKIGFESVHSFTINGENPPYLLGMELSWDGFKNIPHDLYSSNSKPTNN